MVLEFKKTTLVLSVLFLFLCLSILILSIWVVDSGSHKNSEKHEENVNQPNVPKISGVDDKKLPAPAKKLTKLLKSIENQESPIVDQKISLLNSEIETVNSQLDGLGLDVADKDSSSGEINSEVVDRINALKNHMHEMSSSSHP